MDRFQSIWKINFKIRHVQAAFRGLAAFLGALHTYAAIKSQSMNADGISYLDIGDAYFREDWGTAINTVWSPLYSWILGLVNFTFRPSMAWEFPSVHLANFAIFLIALLSFEFMWRNVRSTSKQPDTQSIPDLCWWALGYLLFIWISLSFIEIWAVTPDMLMALFVLLAAGLVTQIRSGDKRLRVFLRLGLVLGLGYLSKTFMFSTALVFLAVAWLVQGWTRESFKRILLASAVFLLVSVPYIALISNARGSLTIGEAGSVTYIRHVIGIPYPHWQGDPAQNIIPTHPSRLIHRSPAVYEFGEPIGGTYPIVLDPSYWFEGISVRATFSGLAGPLLASGIYYLELFFQRQGILTACVLLLYWIGMHRKMGLPEMLRRWAMVIPAIVTFGLYALILVEDRYIGIFVLLFWSDILANIRLIKSAEMTRWLTACSLIAAAGLLANILVFNLDGFNRLSPAAGGSLTSPTAPPATPLAVAQALQELGVQQTDKVGVIGYAYDSFWARLARVKIVAEMLETDAVEFWLADETVRQSVMESFASTGVEAVVAENVPGHAKMDGWHRVGNSNYYIYRFSQFHASARLGLYFIGPLTLHENSSTER